MAALFSSGFFRSGLGALERAALLLDDLAQDNGEAGDGSQHGAQYLGVQSVLVLQSGDLGDLGLGQNLALQERALDGELILHLLGGVMDQTDGDDGVTGTDGRMTGEGH